ncbi:MAG: hypothetical protein ACREO7_12345, partial [Pseudoxanthomonas sp.]
MNREQSKKSLKITRCKTARLLRLTVHLGWVSVTAGKVVIVDQMLRVFAGTDAFKPQLLLVATSSQFIYVS